MATGYTYKIKDGISFEEFALDCAKAFGACIELRDTPNAEIPEKFEIDNYHLEQLGKTETKLHEFKSLTDEEVSKIIESEYDERFSMLKKNIKDSRDLERKYQTMLSKVVAYTPPSDNHVEFKKFMENQIRESIKHDCSDYYEEELKKLTKPSIEEWKSERKESLEWSIEYHTTHWKKAKEVVDGKNLWISQLRDSLNF